MDLLVFFNLIFFLFQSSKDIFLIHILTLYLQSSFLAMKLIKQTTYSWSIKCYLELKNPIFFHLLSYSFCCAYYTSIYIARTFVMYICSFVEWDQFNTCLDYTWVGIGLSEAISPPPRASFLLPFLLTRRGRDPHKGGGSRLNISAIGGNFARIRSPILVHPGWSCWRYIQDLLCTQQISQTSLVDYSFLRS